MTEAWGIVALVAHARRVPSIERARFADQLRNASVRGGLLLETCHRVELYAPPDDDRDRLAEIVPPGGAILAGEEAARHAIAVAVGLDSVVIGEDQVLHQLRTSVSAARRQDRLDPVLERLFSIGLRAGRRARSWRQGPPSSLSHLALAAIESRAGAVGGRRLLIVGSGEMGRLAAHAAAAAGASVLLASRTRAHAVALAGRVGGAAVPFDPGTEARDVAGAIVALRGPWAIGPRTIEALAEGRGVVVDLSVPAAVPLALTRRLDGRVVAADALARGDAHATRPPDARLVALVDAAVAEFSDWLAGRSHRATAATLAKRAEAQRRAELDELWRRLPGLEPEARRAIEGMSRHLTRRLLREPLERLGRDADGRAEQAARELFAL